MFTKDTQYQAYNIASQTVPKTRQIVMLYDGAVRFSKQAREAVEKKDYAERFTLLTKVSDIVVNLQAALDFENGDEIAKLLYDYYASIEARIHYVHRKNDIKILDSIINELKQMRDAWHVIDTKDEAEEGMTPITSDDMVPALTAESTAQQPNALSSNAFRPPEKIDTSKPLFVSA